MTVIRAIVWAEDVFPDTRPKAGPDDVVVTRLRETHFISSPNQDEAVKAFARSIRKLSPKS